jgi:hypothetical protein
LLQLFPNLFEIVNFSVVRNPNALIVITHGLPRRRGKIDDAEPLVTQCNRNISRAEQRLALIIRTAMPEGVAHGA